MSNKQRRRNLRILTMLVFLTALFALALSPQVTSQAARPGLFIRTFSRGLGAARNLSGPEGKKPAAPAGVPALLFADNNGIFQTHLNTFIPRRLTSVEGYGAGYPDWSPDGSQIVFSASNTEAKMGIYVMPATGGSPTLLRADAVDPSWSPDGTRIVFEDWANEENHDIAVMNVDGSNATSITSSMAHETSPAWSPDGKTIAFTSHKDGNAEIYLINPDGSNPRRLTTNFANDGFPSWSPDGTQLAFMSERTGEPTIYVMDANGDNQVAMTNGQNGDYDDFPSWSPDGAGLTFTRRPQGGSGVLYFLDLATSEETRLTWHGNDDFYPDWSPDGEQIVFARNDYVNIQGFQLFVMGAEGEDLHFLAEGILPAANPLGNTVAFTSLPAVGEPEIVVMDREGRNLIELTNNNVDDMYPSWSPDGARIVFQRWDLDQNGDSIGKFIYTMNADGSSQKAITASGTDRYPDWSPGGGRIVFVSYRDGNDEIYVMNSDGSDQKRLTNHDASDISPDWSPDAQKIVFISSREGGQGIYVMDDNGNNVTRLSPPGAFVSGPAWSPDGTLIAYADRDGIYVMKADGNQARRVTVSGVDPAWLPFQPQNLGNNQYLPMISRKAGS